MDIKSKLNLKEPANKKELKSGTIYFIAFKEPIPNKAFSHLLILEDTTKPILTINPFIYILNIPSS